jgi:5-keto-L-gluconate epimerase
MKLSYTYATPDTHARDMLAYRGEMEPAFHQLREFGYEGIELMARDAHELDPEKIQKVCQNTGVQISAVSTGQLRAEDGLTLSDLNEDNRKKTVERTRDVIELAGFFGVQVNIGTLRGSLPQANPEKAKAAAADSLNELLPYAQKYYINIALEPQNRYTINWLNNVPETLDWISQFQHPNLKIVFDVYHWLLEEQSIYASLIRSWPFIGHVQFSDSTRDIPGTGQIDFVQLIEILKALDYQGFISVEALQEPDSNTVAKRSADFLLPLIKH